MDIVFIKGLKVRARVGVFEWERHILQTLVLDIDLRTDTTKVAQSDALQDTVDYKAVSQRVTEFIEASEYQLVESIAEKLADTIIQEFAVGWVRIRIAKPYAVRAAQEVGVLIERGE